MFLKKSIQMDRIKNVSFANGTVSLKDISLNVYCYVVDGVLIDTGSRSLLKELRTFLMEADIDQVVITHLHEDHSGCASVIEQERNVPIYIHEMSLEDCKKNPRYPLYRQIFWGKRKPFSAKPLNETFTSRNATWDVIETPGHARDHNAFLNRQTGQLFSGDLFIQQKTKVVLREESVPTIIESLERILTYDFSEMFCSHAGLVRNGRELLENKKQYLQEIQYKVLSLHQEGHTPESINSMIFKKKYPISKLSFGEWDSIHMVTSIINNQNKLPIYNK